MTAVFNRMPMYSCSNLIPASMLLCSDVLLTPDLHAGSGFDDHAVQGAAPKATRVMDAMDKSMGNIGLGTRAFEPPFTRDKYLEYFRSIAYGDASLRKHGGNRRVDVQMATELSNLYAHHISVQASVKAVVEDDVCLSVLPVPGQHVLLLHGHPCHVCLPGTYLIRYHGALSKSALPLVGLPMSCHQFCLQF